MKTTKYLSVLTLLSAACLFFVGATDEAGTKYLEEKSKEADVITLPSGLRYKVMNKGSGAFHPTVDSPCLCHYGEIFINNSYVLQIRSLRAM
jgi:hypothetical protein